MIVVMVRIPTGSDEEANGMINRFRNRAGLVDNEPGFKGFELLKGDGELISVTRWETRADLDRWMGSQASAAAHSRGGSPMGMAGVAVYEVALPSDGQS